MTYSTRMVTAWQPDLGKYNQTKYCAASRERESTTGELESFMAEKGPILYGVIRFCK